MKFFKFGDYIRSWSVWVLGGLTAGGVLEHLTGMVSAVVPSNYQDIAVAAIGLIGLIARSIKQGGK